MNYKSLLESVTSDKWKRIGTDRRAGVALPLFSIYSKNSVGIGEIPDLRYVIDWCTETGMSIIQLLPLNELGYDYSPYNSISTFAIEPMYLSIKRLRETDLAPFRKELRALKAKFPKGSKHVSYDIKKEKLELLKKIFATIRLDNNKRYKNFVDANFHWLKYYCVYKIITEINGGKVWQDWELKYKYIAPFTTEKIIQNHNAEVEFYCWVQWQLYEQLTTIKNYARSKKVFLMGDLPFLVSRNSADVWAYKNYFKLQLSAGAPPDMYFAKGQRWGMPPYNWDNISADNYGYIRRRLKYAENFYDMYRIDHFVGLFRLWTIDVKTPEEYFGLTGKFDPPDESYWEQHGKSILKVMNESTSMLPCAEDLGTVPDCSDKVLKDFGIPGINVQRWKKDWRDNFKFTGPEDYRINSTATVSTHDSSSLPAWWENEAGTVDEISFRQMCESLNMTDETYRIVGNNLFDEKHSANGRLYWKNEINNIYILLNILKIDPNQAKGFIDLYLSTFGEKNKFWNYLGLKNEFDHKAQPDLIRSSLEMISSTASLFSIQLFMEYLYLDDNILKNYSGREFRINFPGTVDDFNWKMVMPVAMEEMRDLRINKTLKGINQKYKRI